MQNNTVLIVVSIGTIIKNFGATVFLYFAPQNYKKYENMFQDFEVQSTKKLLHQNV